MTITFKEFCQVPCEDVAEVAPKTIVYAAAGTRRSAVLGGAAVEHGNQYVEWMAPRMIPAMNLLFRHGIRDIVTICITPGQMEERGIYRSRLFDWMSEFMAGADSIAGYNRHGWRVRIIGADGYRPLEVAAARLEEETASTADRRLWWMVVPTYESPWEWILRAAKRDDVTSRRDIIRAIFGADVAPAGMFLSFGKPIVADFLIPPPLMAKMQCYWTQRPGYRLREEDIRAILYDYAELRRTWQKDKTGRANAVLEHADVWKHAPTLGIGQKLGPFWYPMPFPELGPGRDQFPELYDVAVKRIHLNGNGTGVQAPNVNSLKGAYA